MIDELWADVVADQQARPVPSELAADLDCRIASYEENQTDVYTLEESMETLRKDREK